MEWRHWDGIETVQTVEWNRDSGIEWTLEWSGDSGMEWTVEWSRDTGMDSGTITHLSEMRNVLLHSVTLHWSWVTPNRCSSFSQSFGFRKLGESTEEKHQYN